MKCETYGIRGPVLSFLRSLLSCRKRYVQIGNMDSDENCIACGVPRGFDSFIIKGINLWNNLDNVMKKKENFSDFKGKLKEKLPSKYEF